MNISFIRTYRSKKGNTVFVYAVNVSDTDKEKYKASQGDNYREDDKTGKPLWFTTRFVGKSGALILTSKNAIVPDMSQYEQANSIAKQFGGNLGQELAKVAAAQLLGASPSEVVETTKVEE